MIREAKLEDSKALVALIDKALGYKCEEEFFRGNLSKINPDFEAVFVAEIDGEVAGFIHVAEYVSLYVEKMANILGLAVDEHFRRRGVATELMQTVEKWAKPRAISSIKLLSGEERLEAHIFYRNYGFIDNKKQLRFTKKI